MIAVVTDSTCDLSPAQLQEQGVTVVPLHVQVGDQQFLDWVELDPDDLYRRMEQGQSASTRPPSAETFADIYRQLLTTHQHVVSLHISAQLSETLQHARQAAQHLGAEDRITIIDSGVTTAPLAELVLRAAHTARTTENPRDVVTAVTRARSRMHAEFTVTDLEYLRRGGRLSRAGEFMANLLNIRPVLTFDDGRIVPARRVRGKGATQDMIARMTERFGNTPINVTIAIAGRDKDRINELRLALSNSSLNIAQGRVQLIGAVTGAHVGPGTYGFQAVPADA
ncbi:DegV family protein [Deinococcus maricopensis]|uniref:DegV family protein n=1 Tax=Deinococcus maricopensis (strain DSM 21211 / LMG 22137 / NRRL B-23946 / LB-34) TaxID=709986 RepID=E8U9B1_DEIML|nr:DegV family protein [Deinococcus maricopensis]ADV67650.1 degV family protein [Deinococcus maricopensis DSM 21211]